MPEEMKPLVTVITGASRGIGAAICDLLLKGDHQVKVYAISRAGTDLGLKANPPSSIIYHSVDVSDKQQVAKLAQTIKDADGRAGINVDFEKSMPKVERAEETIEINYRGVRDMCSAFLPLVTPETGRIVNLSSVGSHLKGYSAENEKRFRGASSFEEVESIANDYLATAEKGDAQQQGWAGPYQVSKALINAYTAVLAKEVKSKGILVNCCCPGWVDTDMGGLLGQPPKSLEDGARIPIRLAFKDIGNVSGRFWENPSVSDTDVSTQVTTKMRERV